MSPIIYTFILVYAFQIYIVLNGLNNHSKNPTYELSKLRVLIFLLPLTFYIFSIFMIVFILSESLIQYIKDTYNNFKNLK